MKRKLFWGCVVLLFLAAALDVWWFAANPSPRIIPQDTKLPEKEIVFTPVDEQAMPTQWIGFLNRDGTGFETRAYQIPTWLFLEGFPVKRYRQFMGRIFTWSLDGTTLGGIFPAGPTNGQGYPVLVHADGSISYCDPSRSIIARDKVLGISESKVVAIEELVNREKNELVEFDMSTCQVSQTIYSPLGNEMLMDFSYTHDGILALELGTTLYWQNDPQNADFVGIRIFGPEMNVVNEISNASHPSLSPDGKKIAFVAAGEVCTSDLDTIAPHCNGETSGMITWSPDGEWLSYSDPQAHIVVHNVETGTQTTIARGIYPGWRP
jgi:hypothetical protein